MTTQSTALSRDSAARSVQRQVAAEVDWFTPAAEKHFDPASVVLALAGLLVSAFVAGFVDEAKKAAGEAGRSVFRRLDSVIKDLFSGRQGAHDPDIEMLADQAPAVLGQTRKSDSILFIEASEKGLREYLETKLPRDRADALAADIKESARTYVLGKL